MIISNHLEYSDIWADTYEIGVVTESQHRYSGQGQYKISC